MPPLPANKRGNGEAPFRCFDGEKGSACTPLFVGGQEQEAYSWRFFYRPQETWEAMYRDCATARRSIEFEQYILENDAVGRSFMELFIRKAKEGLKVFVICDTFGSLLLYYSKLARELRRYGGKLHFYNPLRPWRMFPRTHTKTLLIDSAIAYTGGVCLAEPMRHWRDTHVRVTGPLIGQIRQAFDDIEGKILRTRRKSRPPVRRTRRFFYFITWPRQHRCEVYTEMAKAVKEAKEYIYITSAYFIPNRRFVALLRQAHSRGVDIRVLVPEKSDVRLADFICLTYTPRFIKAGIRLYHYQKTVLHSKTAVIDGNWGTVGSTNFDVISFFHNREANLVTLDSGIAAEMKRQFFIDLENSREFTLEDWRGTPAWKKILGYAARSLQVFF